MIEKVLLTLGVLQGFMERKIAALEREDPIFSDSIQKRKENKKRETKKEEKELPPFPPFTALQYYI